MTDDDRHALGPPSRPIEAVLFDLHFTLVRQRDSRAWIAAARAATGRAGTFDDGLDAAAAGQLLDGLDHLWARAEAIDPGNRRDLDAATHRAVFGAVVGALPGVDDALTAALYASLLGVWVPYPDTLPVLRALAALGVRTAVLSNVGIDVRPMLRRTGIAGLVDAVVLSGEHGVVKPDPALFQVALTAVGSPAERTLMVGDNWRDDGAAAGLGIRTLILPDTFSDGHGLSAVLRLVTWPAGPG